jgi:hypothetical protein
MKRLLLTSCVLLFLAGGAAADAKQAKALNIKGLKLLKAKKADEAQEVFAKAVAADPTMVVAHYNLASAAALNWDLDAVLEQVRWLKQSSDPAALARLTKIKSDRDFTGISHLTPFRESVGLPALTTVTAEVIMQYGGRWNAIDEGMMANGEAYKLTAAGTYTSTGHDGASGSTWSGDGFWRVEDGKLKLSAKKKGPTTDFVFKSCEENGVPAMCLVPPDDASAVVMRPGG